MMPQSTQALYFHLGMNADDDGFCEQFTIMKMTGSKPDDLKLLQAKGFIYIFDDMVLVIIDWKENNYLRKDRYTESKYLELYKDKIEQLRLTSGIPKVDAEEIRKEEIRKDKEKKSKPDIPFITLIIEYLNEKTGSNFRYTTNKYQVSIMARKNNGYKLEDFKKVIDNKLLDKWFVEEKHMNPDTLFSPKFDKYLNEKPSQPKTASAISEERNAELSRDIIISTDDPLFVE